MAQVSGNAGAAKGRVREYDGIIIGGGHNGMILAGYLARAGLKVCCIESEVELGGGLDSHEEPDAPGYVLNIHSYFHRYVLDLPWYHDLQLAEFGAEYFLPDPNCAFLLPDHRAILWYDDPQQTAASIGRISPRDAKTFLDVHRNFQQVTREIVLPHHYSVPVPFAEQQRLLEHSQVGRDYLYFAQKTCDEAIRELFEADEVRALMGVLTRVRCYELDVRGLGHWIPVMVANGIRASLARGSSHRMAHSMHAMMIAFGADMFDASPVSEMIIENGEARGVRCRDGREFRSRFVVSSLNPQLTFLDLAGRENLSESFAAKVENFRYSPVNSILSTHLCLREPPQYKAAAWDPGVQKALRVNMGVNEYQDLLDLQDECRAGKMPKRVMMDGSCPTIQDPTQAPPGHHTAFMWELVPYKINGDPAEWDPLRVERGQEDLEVWRQYAPNLTANVVEHAFWYSPLDVERHNPNFREGDILVGELNEQQLGANRPFPECSDYRTPIKNLYLCGGSSHPHGNVTGAPGYNAASVIVQDMDKRIWWQPPDLLKMWQALK